MVERNMRKGVNDVVLPHLEVECTDNRHKRTKDAEGKGSRICVLIGDLEVASYAHSCLDLGEISLLIEFVFEDLCKRNNLFVSLACLIFVHNDPHPLTIGFLQLTIECLKEIRLQLVLEDVLVATRLGR